MAAARAVPRAPHVPHLRASAERMREGRRRVSGTYVLAIHRGEISRNSELNGSAPALSAEAVVSAGDPDGRDRVSGATVF